MNAKQAKKIRQLYQREFSEEARKMGSLIANSIKPKPKWMPMWLYIKLLSMFIKVKK